MFSNHDNLFAMEETDTHEIFVAGIKRLFEELKEERRKQNGGKLVWASLYNVGDS